MAPKKEQKKDDKKKTQRNSLDECDPTARASSDPCFVPNSVESDNTNLSDEFNKMSLAEQLVVARSFEEFDEKWKERKASIKSVKQIQLMISNMNKRATHEKKKGSKKETERFMKTHVCLNIVFKNTTVKVDCYLSDRVGTIRQLLCVQLAMKRDTKFRFLLSDGEPLKKTQGKGIGTEANSSTFIYSTGLKDGDTITAHQILTDADEEQKIMEDAAVGGIPIEPLEVDDDYVKDMMEQMGWVEDDAGEDEVSDGEKSNDNQ